MRYGILIYFLLSTILCCGLARGQMVRVYIEPDGHFNGETVGESQKWIIEGMREMSRCCGIRFGITQQRAGSDVTIDFQPRDLMVTSDGMVALGLAWRSGRIWFNQDRPLGDIRKNRNVQNLFMHEFLHTIGWDHSESPYDAMYPSLAKWRYLGPREVIKLQRKYGKPDKVFLPMDRAQVGKLIRARLIRSDVLWASWYAETEKRNREQAAGTWDPAHQQKILAIVSDLIDNYSKLATLNQEWHKLNNSWKGVPFAHVSN